MWEQIPPPWQAAMEQAWIAYCAGSLPIGAAIVSSGGQVVTRGRNRLHDLAADGDPEHLRQHFMAHAEQNAFVSLGHLLREQPVAKSVLKGYALYATLEPCDMCTGTLIQSGIRRLHFLVPDPSGGGVDSLRTNPRVREKHIDVQGPQPGEPANIMLGILTVTTARAGIPMPEDIPALLSPYSNGFALGRLLAQSGELDQFCSEQTPVASVFNRLAERLHALSNG